MGRCRGAHLASIRQMSSKVSRDQLASISQNSGQVSRDSAGECQADERAGGDGGGLNRGDSSRDRQMWTDQSGHTKNGKACMEMNN